MKIQGFGSEVGLKHNEPLNVEQDGTAGKPTEQLFGSEVNISRTPVGLEELTHNTGNRMQLFGTDTPCSEKPQKGWESMPTPMSDRAWKASK